MSRAKEALAGMLEGLKPGSAPKWTRKTVFLPQDDGSLLRRTIRADGTIEREDVIPAGKSFPMAARAKTGLSQSEFSLLLGISVRTLHDWEQGRREPSGAARTLLKIAARHPEILREIANEP